MPLEMADAAATAKEIKQLLLDAAPLSCEISKPLLPSCDRITSRAMLTSLGLRLGDRVVIAGQKVGEGTVVSEAKSEVAGWWPVCPGCRHTGVARILRFSKKGNV